MSKTPSNLPPCPFCEGPPSVIVAKAFHPYGAAERGHYGCGGLDVDAYVFCHECGAQGPKHEDTIFCAATYDQAEQKGIALWTERTTKNRHLYDANLAEHELIHGTSTGSPVGLMNHALKGGDQ